MRGFQGRPIPMCPGVALICLIMQTDASALLQCSLIQCHVFRYQSRLFGLPTRQSQLATRIRPLEFCHVFRPWLRPPAKEASWACGCGGQFWRPGLVLISVPGPPLSLQSPPSCDAVGPRRGPAAGGCLPQRSSMTTTAVKENVAEAQPYTVDRHGELAVASPWAILRTGWVGVCGYESVHAIPSPPSRLARGRFP
jgi:hypothetical protein